tara:strand:- start:8577 stop:8801 length:225 start_codon:yes stop_codon:yes gene_type:complete
MTRQESRKKSMRREVKRAAKWLVSTYGHNHIYRHDYEVCEDLFDITEHDYDDLLEEAWRQYVRVLRFLGFEEGN